MLCSSASWLQMPAQMLAQASATNAASPPTLMRPKKKYKKRKAAVNAEAGNLQVCH
jgi:hypothetical protein